MHTHACSARPWPPDSLNTTHAPTLAATAATRPQVDSGCEKDLVFGDPTAPRFVFWENKLRPTPSGLDIATFDLVTILGKIRAGLGAVGLLKAPMPGAGRRLLGRRWKQQQRQRRAAGMGGGRGRR